MKRAYCFGHISAGMLYRIKGNYPAADGYGEIVSAERNFCGEALSSAVVLNRLGVDVELEGNWLGDTDVGRETRAFLRREGIDDGAIVTREGYPGVEEIVICDSVSRTVFGRYEDLLFTTRQWEMPTIKKITRSDIACADPSFGEASCIVARTAAENDIPFVAIDAPVDSPLVTRAQIAIISSEFLTRTYGNDGLEKLFDNYLASCPGLVVFTFGAKALWYGRDCRYTMVPPSVDAVVDTAGAGDSFRAGMMYGMLQCMSDVDMLQYACAVAAVVVTSSPGVLGFVPTEHLLSFA
ncbi:MAG: carbohydrate kinase family protein [Deltaproteobacteria bacterium]|nr:carbohydrate kinase family protein [Deltaproteobacteria bacterium]MBN2671500.1 carbohydrate kinase family protein [Deltaproteobacteria bacterium]